MKATPSNLSPGQRRLLALASAAWPRRYTTPEIRQESGYAAGSIRTFLPALVEAGYLTATPKGWMISPAARIIADDSQPNLTRHDR